MPSRIDILPKAIESIYEQADIIRVYLNNFEQVPEFLIDSKIETVIGEDLGDTGKFFWALNPDEYYFSIDDDLIYPKDYVSWHLTELYKWGNRAIVSLHGVRYKRPFEHYNTGRIEIKCLNEVLNDETVDIIGSGVCVFNTNMVKVDYKDFLYKNMADIWLSKLAHEQKIPLVVRKHKADYLKYLNPDYKTTIDFTSQADNRKHQTEILKSFLL
jgi:hypothetical protein